MYDLNNFQEKWNKNIPEKIKNNSDNEQIEQTKNTC